MDGSIDDDYDDEIKQKLKSQVIFMFRDKKAPIFLGIFKYCKPTNLGTHVAMKVC
jgi:hypothetical protein